MDILKYFDLKMFFCIIDSIAIELVLRKIPKMKERIFLFIVLIFNHYSEVSAIQALLRSGSAFNPQV